MEVTFGVRLRGLRQAAGLTLEQLSEASGVSVRAISDIERGHSRAPQPRSLAALARALGVDGPARYHLEETARAVRAHRAVGRPPLTGLPRGVTDFVGRAAELRRVERYAAAATHGTPVPVVVVHGPPGVGKTALAVRAARSLRERFPHGVHHVDLRGTDPVPLTAGQALTRLLRTLDVSARRTAVSDEERASQLRELLRTRRCLLVLDNAATEAQLRWLLPGDGPGLVVATSRRALSGLEGVRRVGLAPLDRAESVQLLHAVAGPAALRRGPDGRPGDPATDVDAVARLCGDLPLALRIAGTRLASRPQWTVADLVASLTPAEHRLANLSCGDASVAAAFALSHAQLSEPARTLFRRLARLPGTDVAAPVATALLDTGPVPVADLLDELVECGLLEPRGPERYRFHDLVRLFAADRLRVEEPVCA